LLTFILILKNLSTELCVKAAPQCPPASKLNAKTDDDDDDEDDDDEIEVSNWLIAAYPNGASCFLFQIFAPCGLCRTWTTRSAYPTVKLN